MQRMAFVRMACSEDCEPFSKSTADDVHNTVDALVITQSQKTLTNTACSKRKAMSVLHSCVCYSAHSATDYRQQLQPAQPLLYLSSVVSGA